MRGWLTVAGCCAALLPVACGESPSPAGPSVHPAVTLVSDSRSGGVPFKGSLDGRYGLPTGEFPLIHESIVATGQATHLGRYTLEIEETVNLLQATAIGTFTFTAANGDTVYGNYTGHAQLGPVVTIFEDATVRGGTGRFEGATGSFSIERTFDPVNRTTKGLFDGTISGVGGR